MKRKWENHELVEHWTIDERRSATYSSEARDQSLKLRAAAEVLSTEGTVS